MVLVNLRRFNRIILWSRFYDFLCFIVGEIEVEKDVIVSRRSSLRVLFSIEIFFDGEERVVNVGIKMVLLC